MKLKNCLVGYWEKIEKKLILAKYEKFLIAAKETITLQRRIGKTCFTSIYIIGRKIYSNHIQNINNVHKHSKELVSAIITLGKI